MLNAQSHQFVRILVKQISGVAVKHTTNQMVKVDVPYLMSQNTSRKEQDCFSLPTRIQRDFLERVC